MYFWLKISIFNILGSLGKQNAYKDVPRVPHAEHTQWK